MTELFDIIDDIEIPGEPGDELTHEDVRREFDYNPVTGKLTRRLSRRKVGYINDDGYDQIQIRGRHYSVHCVIWFWVTGSWPEDEIDHWNLNKTDNVWGNLRQATKSQMYNRLAQKNNTSGFKGVWRHGNKWRACIGHLGKTIHLGRFDKPEGPIQPASPKCCRTRTSIGHQEPTITGFGRSADAEPLSSGEQMTPLSSGRYLDAAELPRRGHFFTAASGKKRRFLPLNSLTEQL
jgi:HNH endonuclease